MSENISATHDENGLPSFPEDYFIRVNGNVKELSFEDLVAKEVIPPGFTIYKDKCISCGSCAKVCTFNAIIPGEKYSINPNRCDERGSCYSVCPVNAVQANTPMDESYRIEY